MTPPAAASSRRRPRPGDGGDAGDPAPTPAPPRARGCASGRSSTTACSASPSSTTSSTPRSRAGPRPGSPPSRSRRCEALTFSVADMAGLYLGSFAPGADHARQRRRRLRLVPRRDAARRHASSATSLGATRLQTDPTGAPAGHYDLLTTVMHEMGHVLGLEDSYAPGRPRRPDVRLAVHRRAAAARRGRRRRRGRRLDHQRRVRRSLSRFAADDIGVLPAGKAVTIQWQATIDPQTNQLIVNPVNQGTVTATNVAGFPDYDQRNTVTTMLDSLTLGGTDLERQRRRRRHRQQRPQGRHRDRHRRRCR